MADFQGPNMSHDWLMEIGSKMVQIYREEKERNEKMNSLYGTAGVDYCGYCKVEYDEKGECNCNGFGHEKGSIGTCGYCGSDYFIAPGTDCNCDGFGGKKPEIVPFEYKHISREAIGALKALDIKVNEDKDGFSFEVPGEQVSWDSDDNGGSYNILIKGQKFWLDANGEQGLQLDQ